MQENQKIEWKIIDHGCDGEQYFPGCGVAFSTFDHVSTGIGYSAREAAWDAIECAYPDIPVNKALESEINALPDAPSFDPEDPEISPEWHHYVSIRYRVARG